MKNTLIKYLSIASMQADKLGTKLTKAEMKIIKAFFWEQAKVNLRNESIYQEIETTTKNLIDKRSTETYKRAIAEIERLIAEKEIINKHKQDFKKHCENYGTEWVEKNFVVYSKDEIIESEKIIITDEWKQSSGYMDDNNSMISGMYCLKTKQMIASDFDMEHIGKYYGNYWFSMNNWEME